MKLMVRKLLGLYGARYYYVVGQDGEKLSGGWSTVQRAVADMKKMRARRKP